MDVSGSERLQMLSKLMEERKVINRADRIGCIPEREWMQRLAMSETFEVLLRRDRNDYAAIGGHFMKRAGFLSTRFQKSSLGTGKVSITFKSKAAATKGNDGFGVVGDSELAENETEIIAGSPDQSFTLVANSGVMSESSDRDGVLASVSDGGEEVVSALTNLEIQSLQPEADLWEDESRAQRFVRTRAEFVEKLLDDVAADQAKAKYEWDRLRRKAEGERNYMMARDRDRRDGEILREWLAKKNSRRESRRSERRLKRRQERELARSAKEWCLQGTPPPLLAKTEAEGLDEGNVAASNFGGFMDSSIPPLLPEKTVSNTYAGLFGTGREEKAGTERRRKIFGLTTDFRSRLKEMGSEESEVSEMSDETEVKEGERVLEGQAEWRALWRKEKEQKRARKVWRRRT